jgi:hypothetical protein
MSPWFGKKKQEEPDVSKLVRLEYRKYIVSGPTSGLAFCNLDGNEAICASALDSHKIKAWTTSGDQLWEFTSPYSVFSLVKGNFGGKDVIAIGGGGSVIAISEAGEKLWEYEMPEGSGIMSGLSGATIGLHEMQNVVGFGDVYHLAAGKLNNDDVIVAVAAGKYLMEGPQVIDSRGEQVCALKTKTLGMTRPIQIAGCMLDLLPSGDGFLGMVAYKAFGKASVITKEGKMIRDIKLHMDEARKPGSLLPLQDKRRGGLVSGKFGNQNVFIASSPHHISVAAVSLDGPQLWNYLTTRAIGDFSGVNDLKIGTLAGKPVVVAGCLDGSVHIIDEAGYRLDSWQSSIPVTNVGWGKIESKDAVAVGLYDGKVTTYTLEPV